jgi:hypothetical protein
MGAPMGNRNAAGGRGGATNRLRKSLRKGKRKGIMNKLTGKKPVSNSYRYWQMTHKGKKR